MINTLCICVVLIGLTGCVSTNALPSVVEFRPSSAHEANLQRSLDRATDLQEKQSRVDDLYMPLK